MSVDYEVFKTIDHSNPAAMEIYKKAVEEWHRRCIKKVVPRKTLRKGGRTLKRALDRKECEITETEDEENDRLINEFTAGDRTISTLHVTFENFEREEEPEEVGA